MKPESDIFYLDDRFHAFDWPGVVEAVKQGHKLTKALHLDFKWGRLFPEGISQEHAKVLFDCDLNLPSPGGKSVLHAFCECGDTSSVRNLLDAGFDPDVVGNFGMCPLVYALYGMGDKHCAVSTACLLLDRGASPNAEGLGSAGRASFGRASFVFLEVLNNALESEGWDGIDRLWTAISRNADWSLPYEDNLSINYFLFDIACRYPANNTIRSLYWDALQRLEAMGVSFDPSVRDEGFSSLGKHVRQIGGNAQWLMDKRNASLCYNALNDSAPPTNNRRNRSRL